jgi:pyruvate kinase
MAALVREASHLVGKHVALLADLQGAKVRLGWLTAPIPIRTGQQVILVGPEQDARERPADHEPDAVVLPVDFDLPPHLKPQATVLIDDGNLELSVEAIVGGHVHTRVVHGGEVKSRKGVNVPYTCLPIPALTDKDRADAEYAVGIQVDWIALSFAGSDVDVEELRGITERAMRPGHLPPRIMAKIERPDGVENLRPIIQASDGVMVARGDLALETSPWQLPLLQKQIVRACRVHNKPVVVATQMLESMIHNHRPTRAEVSDVANALLDGADGIMLSGETAVGKFPVQAVRTMAVISQGTLPPHSQSGSRLSVREVITGVQPQPIQRTELPVVSFESVVAWEAWLEENHASSPGVWLKIARKGAGMPSVSYREALEGALCFGWFNGQKRALDDTFWLQKFTPRRPLSRWSMDNRSTALYLIEQGRMRPAGLREVEDAWADGRLDAGDAWIGGIEVPSDLQAALAASPEAATFFDTLDLYNRSVVIARVQMPKKPKAQRKRIAHLVGMLARGEIPRW